MSRTKTYYCSCSTCTQIRNEKPNYSRYKNPFRYLLACACCSSDNQFTMENHQTYSPINNSRMSAITFRDTDINNKHCSKHDVMIKASRPYFSKYQSKQLRQRVKDANQRWKRMSTLPANFIDFIFKNKDFIPLCSICYENLSLLEFNLCHRCITTLINYQKLIQQRNFSLSTIQEDQSNTSPITSEATVLKYNESNNSEEIEESFLDCIQ